MIFEWETIYDGNDFERVERAMVPGGWIVRSSQVVYHYRNQDDPDPEPVSISESTVLVPDPGHTWNITKEKPGG